MSTHNLRVAILQRVTSLVELTARKSKARLNLVQEELSDFDYLKLKRINEILNSC
jgi:hypothetical protein